MASNWREVLLDEVASEITVGHVGSMADEYIERGVPMLRSLNIEPLRINTRDLKYIPREFHLKLKKSKLQVGDVVIVRTGKPGACAVVPEWLNDCNCSDLVIVRCGPELYNHFLSYYINSAAKTHISAHLVGAVQQHFNVSSAKTLKLLLPSLSEQKRIAGILGALDDKIELNRRMNETLEQMARALFKSWFVDFDPVHAKAAGRQPFGMDKATADLFPYSFEESELGLIPKGFRPGKVSDAFDLTMGQSPVGESFNEDSKGIPFYQGSTDFGFRFPARRIFTTLPARYAKEGDTLVSVRAPVGDINMASEDCCIGRGVAAIRYRTGARSFTYYAIENLKPHFDKFEADGTVFGSINKQNFENLPFVIPPQELSAAFEQKVGQIDKEIHMLAEQSRTLVALRDLLLPKLLCGGLEAIA